jgi:TonB family protein
METLKPSRTASPVTEPELHLLIERPQLLFTAAEEQSRWRSAAIGSVVWHLFVIAVLILTPDAPVKPLPDQPIIHIATLYTPTDLTQRAPNKGKITKEISAESIAPHPVVKAPAPAPAAAAQPRPAVIPPVEKPPVAKPELTEPPKIVSETPAPVEIAQIQKIPLPSQVEQPKLAMQNVAPTSVPGTARPQGAVAIPNPSVQDALRNLSRNGVTGTQSVGDLNVDEGGIGPGLNLPPSAGRPRSALELKSDPMGVDFRPYLIQVLAAVRRNWFAVYPEAARLGQRGQVILQFAIGKRGELNKVVFSTESGAKALDQAAVAAISASNPLPPLPTDYKGDRVVLQLTFAYNMPR